MGSNAFLYGESFEGDGSSYKSVFCCVGNKGFVCEMSNEIEETNGITFDEMKEIDLL